MAEELEPLKQYLLAEVWEYESGRCGWKISSMNNEAIVWLDAGGLFLELSESLIAGEGNAVVFSIFSREDGAITTRKPRDRDLTEFKDYLWVRGQMHKATQNLLFRKPVRTPKLFYWCWSIQWLYLHLRGRFKASRGPRYAAATPAPAPLTEKLSDISEASQTQSQGSGGTVVQLRPRSKPDDIRPL